MYNSSSYYGSYSEEFNLKDDNLPGYFHEYIAYCDLGQIQESLISLLPTNENGIRVLNMECKGLLETTHPSGNHRYTWTITFDILTIQIFNAFVLENGIEGILTIEQNIYNAKLFMNYSLDEKTRKLYIDISIPSSFVPTPSIPISFNFNIYIQDDYTNSYTLKVAYEPWKIPYEFRGAGKTILLTAWLTAGYLLSDIVDYLRLQGIVKTEAQLASQIIASYNCSSYAQFYHIDRYYPIPRSNGYICNPSLSEFKTGSSVELSMNLQYIFTVTPDVNVIILYFGYCCQPDTPPDPNDPTNAEMQLVRYMLSIADQYDVISDSYGHLQPYLFDEAEQAEFQSIMTQLYNQKKMIFTASGNQGIEEYDYWASLKYVFTLGGMTWQEDTINNLLKPYCWPRSSGGFYDDEVPFLLPYYQVGLVPLVYNGTDKLIGVPSACGISANLLMQYDRVVQTINGTSCGPPVYAPIVIQMMEATNYKNWSFLDILYYEYQYLFNYIDNGQNSVFSASNFLNWNPIAGLGWLNTTRLLKLVEPSQIYSTDKLCISSVNVQNEMSYLNFYPPSPFYEQEIRQPVFGPLCYWSYLAIYKYNASTNTLDVNKTLIANGDYVCIFSTLPTLLHWVLSYNDVDDFVYLQKYANTLTTRMVWKMTIPNNHYYEPFILSPLSKVDSHYLSSEFGTSNPKSSPSVSINITYSELIFRKHPTFIDNNLLYVDLVAANIAYYVNISNGTYFMTSHYTPYNYTEGRSAVNTQDVLIDYDEFSVYPEFLLIPLNIIPPITNVTPTFEQVELRDNAAYMIFNTRIQAYVFINQQYVVQFINVNNVTSSIRKYIYDSCIMDIGSSNLLAPTLFRPTFSDGPLLVFSPSNKSSAARYNDFMTEVTVLNIAGYNNPQNTWFTNNEYASGTIITTNDGNNINRNVYILSVDPKKILSNEICWLRQVNEKYYQYYNAAIYPNPVNVNGNPFMGGYYNGDVLYDDSVVGSWLVANSQTSINTQIYDQDLQPKYYYTTPDANFTFRGVQNISQYLANFSGNPPQWQPQMYKYDGITSQGHWALLPYFKNSIGPLSNYVYTNGLYIIKSDTNGRYLSVIMGLEKTPSMMIAGNVLYSHTELCLYTPRIDDINP